MAKQKRATKRKRKATGPRGGAQDSQVWEGQDGGGERPLGWLDRETPVGTRLRVWLSEAGGATWVVYGGHENGRIRLTYADANTYSKAGYPVFEPEVSFGEWNAEHAGGVDHREDPGLLGDAQADQREAVDAPAADGAPSQKTPRARLVAIPVEAVAAEGRARTDFDDGALIELVDDIACHGQMQPIVVLERAKGYLLIAGERRLLAARRGNEAHIEAMVYPRGSLSDAAVAEMELAENFQRRDFNHVETARALGKMRDTGATTAQIAAKAHKSVDWVREHLDLLRLDEAVLAHVASGRIPIKQAAMIARVGDPAAQVDVAFATVGGWDQWSGGRTVKDLDKQAAECDTVRTMRAVREMIAHRLKALGSCGWPMDTEYAGKCACAGCPDNSASAEVGPLLAGVKLPGTSKKGNCSNAGCYAAKAKAWDRDPVKKKRDAEREAKKKAKAKAAGKDPDATPSGRPAKSKTLGPYPQTEDDYLAVATLAYGRGLLAAVTDFVRAGTDPLPADLPAICWRLFDCQAWNDVESNPGSTAESVAAFAALGEDLLSSAGHVTVDREDLANVIETVFRHYGGDWTPTTIAGARGEADDVAALATMEALGQRWGILGPGKFDDERPTLASIKADRIVQVVWTGKKPDVEAALAEVTDPDQAMAIYQAAGKRKKLAKWRRVLLDRWRGEVCADGPVD